jgi:hypothetical protein
MAISAQEKMLYVANKLGLSTLKNMQGSTRVVYDQQTTAALDHTLFAGSAQRNFPLTNLGANGNQFQVNEALLVEQIGFFIPDAVDGENYRGLFNIGPNVPSSVKFDLVIGNKTVIKDCVVEGGGQQAFYNDGTCASSIITLEGVGILIPPQVEFYVRANVFDTRSRGASTIALGCYLFGTAALLNFNTTI